MKIKKDTTRITIPDYSYIVSVLTGDKVHGPLYALMHIPREQLVSMREKTPQNASRGRPVYFSLDDQTRTLHIFPHPSEDIELHVRYAPPLMEI